MSVDLYIQSSKKGPRPLERDVFTALFKAFAKIGYAEPREGAFFRDAESRAEFRAGGFNFLLEDEKSPSKYDLKFLYVDVSTSVYPDHTRFGYNYNAQILSELGRAENNPLPLIFHLGMALCALEVAGSLHHDTVSVYTDGETDLRSTSPSGEEGSRMRPFLEICNETTIELGASKEQSGAGVRDLISSVATDLEQELEYKGPYELRKKIVGQELEIQNIAEPILSLGRRGYGFYRNASELREGLRNSDDFPLIVAISFISKKREQVYPTDEVECDLNLVFFISPCSGASSYEVELYLVSQALLSDLSTCDTDEETWPAAWKQRMERKFEANRPKSE